MRTVTDVVDFEDVRQPPLEGAGMRRETVRVDGGHPLGGSTDMNEGERELYYSFSQCIANEVPPHYRSFYISYDACKDLIRYLDAANDAFQRGVKFDSAIPLKIRKMLNDSLQSLLGAHSSSIDESVVRALVPQVFLPSPSSSLKLFLSSLLTSNSLLTCVYR